MTKAEVHKRIDELTPRELKIVEEVLESLRHQEQEQPQQKVSIRGKFAHVPTSSEDFNRRKQEEIDLEDRRWR